MAKVWSFILILFSLFGCTPFEKQQNLIKTEGDRNPPEYQNSQLVGQYRAYTIHGYDWVEITEAGEIIYDDSQTKERIVYKYYVDGDTMKLRRTGEDTVYDCKIKELTERQIHFDTYPEIRFCPIAAGVDYLTRTD